ncbi:MAG: S8 family serine peptidase [Epsilonproteobacteria bacterium]|nr:S8 family serine peptidase [Campylobacterota bacterium]
MKLFVSALVILFFVACNKNTSVEDEPLYQEQWALHYDKAFYDAYAINKDAHIHASNSFKNYTGKNVKVAIIDIGFDTNHFEYKNNIIKTINSADGSSNVECTNSNECYHGSAVTGIIASNINNKGLRGIAPDVKLILIKLDLAGYVGDDEILNALQYAQDENVDIINNSWGTGDISPIVKEKIDDMATNGRDGKGIVFVFASGNKGKENNKDESMIDSVIGVGSSDEENLRAIYSNFGNGLDLVAPGGYNLGITTTYDSNDTNHISDFMKAEDYKKFQGTSASAPIVTGAIALLLEKNPNLTRVQIQEILNKTSDKIGNVAYINHRNNYYGYGKLNIDKMLSTTNRRN